MTDLTARAENRSFHFQTGGNDDNDGTTYNKAFASPNKALAACFALDPPPTLFSQAAIINLATGNFEAKLYDLTGIVIRMDGTSLVEVSGEPFVLKMGSFTNADISTATNATENGRAVICDGEQRTAIEYKFLAARGAGVPVCIEFIGECNDIFSTGGQLSSYGVGIQDMATGTDSAVHYSNLITLERDGAIGACIGAVGTVKSFEFGKITPRKGLALAGTIGVKGSGGNVTSRGSEVKADTAIILPDGTGSEWTVDYSRVSGDIYVGVGCRLDCDIINHPVGNVTILGECNGNIGGVDYGVYIDDVNYTAEYFRAGNIPTSFDDFGWILLNGLTDVMQNILVSYTQGNNSSRTVDFQIVNASDANIVYFSGSNTASTSGPHSFNGAVAGVALPNSDTLCKLRIKDSGSQVSDAGANVYFTRTP